MKLTPVIFAALLLGASSIAAQAASGGLWNTLPTTSYPLTGNEMVPADTGLPNGEQPQTEYIAVPQLRAIAYSQQTPLTGFSITFPAGVKLLQLTPAGTLATGTITMPASPVDGQEACIFDTQTQTAVTISANTGQTINGTAITALTANTRYCYFYEQANTTWYREN